MQPQTIHSLLNLPLFEPIWPALSFFQNGLELPPICELKQKFLTCGVTFVAQGEKSLEFSDGYEQRIFLKGEVQTRERSWHDFFNAAVWQSFPQTKKAINIWQYQLQKHRFPQKRRLPAENMLTLFDENGAIVVSQDPLLLDLIREHRWHELFWQRREQTKRDLRVHILGHGLYEKALHPYVGLTAQALLLQGSEDALDTRVAQYLESQGAELKTRHLTPLPVLGVPGFWDANRDEAFYQNEDYFRPRRTNERPEGSTQD